MRMRVRARVRVMVVIGDANGINMEDSVTSSSEVHLTAVVANVRVRNSFPSS